jgi:starch synthase (maltosyl-transferring)
VQLDGRRRVIIEALSPSVDDGRFPAKRAAGDVVQIEADVFTDGHDLLSAVMLHRHESEKKPAEVRMTPLVNDRWRAEITVDRLGFHFFTVEAWVDHFLTWHRDLRKRVDAGQSDIDVQLLIGLEMIRAAAGRAKARDKKRLARFIDLLEGEESAEEKIPELWSEELLELMWRNADRGLAVRYPCEMAIEVDPPRAAFSAWYELFPRSFGGFRGVEKQLPRIARMGFDVLYLPPIHPIGVTFRKGRNNAVAAEAGDAGSPWAIGAAEGGHTAVHTDLGTIDDFRALVESAKSHGIDVALDIAFQASPDHPYVREHPEWFLARPDGTIQYAENPPKKYQDIYPFHFESEAWKELWEELRDVFRYWVAQGVRVFRVDNPHTKPLPFWQWVIREIRDENPEVIFLAEAFTRPKIMYWLAKAGFNQSYTYFAWRNTSAELREYFEEITKPPVSDFFRPNAWPNTPDILTEYLQFGGRPAFVIRLILAATLSANYGVYGPAFERFVAEPREPGSEEYRDSEKYEARDWGEPDDDLSEMMTVVNRIRRENPALQRNTTLEFHPCDNPELVCYSKSAGENVIVCVVNLDPHNTQSGTIDLQLELTYPFQVHDLLSGRRFTWHSGRNLIELNPHIVPAHIFRIRRKVRSERDFEYFL